MQFKTARAKAVIAADSKTIGKIGNAGIDDSELTRTGHKLISISSAFLRKYFQVGQWHYKFSTILHITFMFLHNCGRVLPG